jgi:hypothetical protein
MNNRELTKAEKRQALKQKKECTNILFQGIVQVAISVPSIHIGLLICAGIYEHYPEIGRDRTAIVWMYFAVSLTVAVLMTILIFWAQHRYRDSWWYSKLLVWIGLFFFWLPAASLANLAAQESYFWSHPEPGPDRTFAVGMGTLLAFTATFMTVGFVVWLNRECKKKYDDEAILINSSLDIPYSQRLTEMSVSTLNLSPSPALPPVVTHLQQKQQQPQPQPVPVVQTNNFMMAGRVSYYRGDLDDGD